MLKKHTMVLLSLLIAGTNLTAEIKEPQTPPTNLIVYKSFLDGIMRGCFFLSHKILTISDKMDPSKSHTRTNTCIHTFAHDTFPKIYRTDDATAYDIFSTINTLIAFKQQPPNNEVMVKYFTQHSKGIFPVLAQITERVYCGPTPYDLMFPHIFFDYAQTPEFKLFCMANIITQHLINSKSVYHDYFLTVRSACLTRDYGAVKQAKEKYPALPLCLHEEEQYKVIDKTLCRNIDEIKHFIDRMPDNSSRKTRGTELFIECLKKYNACKSTFCSVSQAISDKEEK